MWSHDASLLPLFAGRLFDFHVLDMIELGIEKYVSLSDVKVMVAVIQLQSVSAVLKSSSLNFRHSKVS